MLITSKTEFSAVSTNLSLKKQHYKSKQTAWYSFHIDTEWSMWLFSCQNTAVQFDIVHNLISSAVWYCWQIWYDLQFDIICSLILCVIWYCLHSFILFFLFNFNCASTSFYIFRLEHALLILYFFSLYSHWGRWHFFKRGICYGFGPAARLHGAGS